jgi:hypothetical protein
MKPLIETGSDRFIVVSKSLGGPAFYEAIIAAPGCVSVRTLANSKRRLRARLNAKCAGANTARKSSSLPAPMPRLAQATRRRGTRAIRCPFRSAGFTRALGRVRLYASSDSARSARGSI